MSVRHLYPEAYPVTASDRPTRAQPERSRPNREFSNILNQNTGSTSNGTDNAQASGENWTDTVGYGVKLGYRVIEEQIRQGQRIAQQVNSGSYGMGSMNNDVQELAQSIQRYCEDSAQLYLKLMGSMTSDLTGRATGNGDAAGPWNAPVGEIMETFLGNLGKFTSPESYTGATGFQPNAGSAGGFNQQTNGHAAHRPVQPYTSIQLQVHSTKPVEINVNLQSAADKFEVDRLHEQDASLPAVTNVILALSEQTLTVSVTIDDDQPDGNYNGIVYDAGSRSHCGTMSIRIGASPGSTQ